MTVVTRFAPSPTGFLHIGSARTALFNWLFARHHGGRYLLRIEDTDRKRSTPEAVAAILDGLEWLGLSGDEDAIFQFTRRQRHAEVAQQMLEARTAYYCYASAEELAEMRATAKSEGRAPGYDGRWRDRDPADAPAGVAPAIRLKAPQDGGEMVINDLVQGRVVVAHAQLDDMILLRADGTPTYMLSVVVDDHDISHFKSRIHSPSSVGYNQTLDAKKFHYPDGKSHLLHGVSFVVVKPTLHNQHPCIAQFTGDQSPRMPFNSRDRKIGDTTIFNQHFCFHLIHYTSQSCSKDDGGLRHYLYLISDEGCCFFYCC